ncbi:MAG TPA: methyltransferase domain-containing protein [Candidatus Binataceae bacterium]
MDWKPPYSRRWIGWLLAAATLTLLLTSPRWARAADRKDADDLATLLGLGPGSVVAEVGAGKGKLSQIMAEKVGYSGRVYATEIDQTRLAELREIASDKNLGNLTVIEASETDSGLPANCCDAIFMTAVYHHFTKPAQTDASLYRALRPGGKIAVLDFRPTPLLALWKVKGVPANRGGHGVPPEIVRQEMTTAGFKLLETVDPWPRGWPLSNFCEVFSKPP